MRMNVSVLSNFSFLFDIVEMFDANDAKTTVCLDVGLSIGVNNYEKPSSNGKSTLSECQIEVRNKKCVIVSCVNAFALYD